MSTTQTSHEPDHGSADHGDENEHGHGGATLGPIDLAAWGALLLGIAAGLTVAVCLYVTTVLLKSPIAH